MKFQASRIQLLIRLILTGMLLIGAVPIRSEEPCTIIDIRTEFDRTYDSPGGGGRFSCIGTTASLAQQALDDLREGVVFDNMEGIERVFAFPLRINIHDENGSSERVVESPQQWVTTKQELVTRNQVALMACSSVRTVSVVGWRGFMIGHGLVWLSPINDDPSPKVIAINLHHISDAHLAELCTQGLGPN